MENEQNLISLKKSWIFFDTTKTDCKTTQTWTKTVYTKTFQTNIFWCVKKKKNIKGKNTCMYTYSWMDFKWHEQALWTHLKQNKTKKDCDFSVYIRSNFSLRNSSTLSVFHLRMLSSSAMFPPSSKSFSTGSEPLTYCSDGRREGGKWSVVRGTGPSTSVNSITG